MRHEIKVLISALKTAVKCSNGPWGFFWMFCSLSPFMNADLVWSSFSGCTCFVSNQRERETNRPHSYSLYCALSSAPSQNPLVAPHLKGRYVFGFHISNTVKTRNHGLVFQAKLHVCRQQKLLTALSDYSALLRILQFWLGEVWRAILPLLGGQRRVAFIKKTKL